MYGCSPNVAPYSCLPAGAFHSVRSSYKQLKLMICYLQNVEAATNDITKDISPVNVKLSLSLSSTSLLANLSWHNVTSDPLSRRAFAIIWLFLFPRTLTGIIPKTRSCFSGPSSFYSASITTTGPSNIV